MYLVRRGLGFDAFTTDNAGAAFGLNQTYVLPLSGQFLLDPNEINGWGILGPHDNTNNQDLGNSTPQPANLAWTAGGYCFPFDVKLNRLFAWHRNNNNAAEAWGWVVAMQNKTPNATTVSTAFVLDEVDANGGAGPRNYLNNRPQQTDVALTGVLSAGAVLCLGVSAPTAQTTNRWVQVLSGYIEVERVW